MVAAIADDLSDGELDGRGGGLASNRVAAVSKLTSTQVLIEALSNSLEVGGTLATGRLDDAIVATRPSVPLSALTGSVPVNQELLVQVRDTRSPLSRRGMPLVQVSPGQGHLQRHSR